MINEEAHKIFKQKKNQIKKNELYRFEWRFNFKR